MDKNVNIFGDITAMPRAQSDVSAESVLNLIQDATKADKLFININSYGGEVFEAIAIANIIASCPAPKIFNVIGICASATTMIFNATDKVNIARGAMVMYHKPIGEVVGNSIQLRKTAKLLDKIEKENVMANLMTRTNKPLEYLTPLVENEWWLSSEEAVQMLGFIDAGVPAIENRAQTTQIGIYKNYIARKKALASNAYQIFINHKSKLK